MKIIKVQGKDIDVDAIRGDADYNAPFGLVIGMGDFRHLVMTKKEAKRKGFEYITHSYSTYGSVALVGLTIEESREATKKGE